MDLTSFTDFDSLSYDLIFFGLHFEPHSLMIPTSPSTLLQHKPGLAPTTQLLRTSYTFLSINRSGHLYRWVWIKTTLSY